MKSTATITIEMDNGETHTFKNVEGPRTSLETICREDPFALHSEIPTNYMELSFEGAVRKEDYIKEDYRKEDKEAADWEPHTWD